MRIFTTKQLANVTSMNDLEELIPLVNLDEAKENLKKVCPDIDNMGIGQAYDEIQDRASDFFRMMSLSRYTACSFEDIVETLDTVDLTDYLENMGLHLSLDMSPITMTSVSDEDYREILYTAAKICGIQAKTPAGIYFLLSLLQNDDPFYTPVYDLYLDNIDKITSGDQEWGKIILDYIHLNEEEMRESTISNLGGEYIMTNPVMGMGDAPTIKLLRELMSSIATVQMICKNRIRMWHGKDTVYDITYLV